MSTTHSTRRLVRAAAVCVGLVVAGTTFAQPTREGAWLGVQDAKLEAEQKRELDHLLDDLRDSKLDLSRRRRAAAILLDRPWPQASLALRRVLILSDDASTLRAVVQAIAAADAPPQELVVPLVRRLDSADATLRGEVAAALGRFDDPKIIRLVTNMAMESGQSEAARLGATQTLAWYRTANAAGALIVIVDDAASSPALRLAAFEALAHLTGIREFGQDLDAWLKWWSHAGQLDEGEWNRELMRHFTERDARLDKQLAELTARLNETYTQLYDAASEDHRPAILQKMLADELPDLRLKALKLIEQRLLNAQTIGGPLRAAVRERLTDGTAPVRTQAAYVLESLKDVEAAQLAVELLPTETQAAVQISYLRLLARVPQRDAVETALRLIENPELRGPAAGFILAAFDANLLEPQHVESAVKACRSHLASPTAVSPMTVKLLGHVGLPDDQALVAPLLTHADPLLRTAAVEAHDNESWPLIGLVEFLNDAQLRPTIYKVVARRGRAAELVLKLLDREPKEPEPLAEWKRTLVAVASRLAAADLVKVDASLAKQPSRRELHESLLKSSAGITDDTMPATTAPAPDANGETSEARKVESELLLSELYLRNREPAKAKPLYTKVLARPTLGADTRRRAELGRMEMLLQQQTVDEALAQTQQLLAAGQSPTADQLAALWLDAADRAVLQNKISEANSLSTRITQLFSGKIAEETQNRHIELKKKLPAAAPAPAPPPTEPKKSES